EPFRKALQRRWSIAERAHDAVADRTVVVEDVALREAATRKVDLVGAGQPHRAPGDLHLHRGSRLGHVRTLCHPADSTPHSVRGVRGRSAARSLERRAAHPQRPQQSTPAPAITAHGSGHGPRQLRRISQRLMSMKTFSANRWSWPLSRPSYGAGGRRDSPLRNSTTMTDRLPRRSVRMSVMPSHGYDVSGDGGTPCSPSSSASTPI